MFWGVALESGKRYSQIVESSFHLSMAALEPTTKANHYVSVMIEHSGVEFLLCTLEHNKLMQVALDLLFVVGEELSFFLNGEGTVHLSGYVLDDDNDDQSLASSEESEVELVDEEISEDWTAKKDKKRKSSTNVKQVSVQKKMKNEILTPKQAKSPKVDIVEMPSSGGKFTPSKSPFANKSNELKNKSEKKKAQNNSKVQMASDDDDSSDVEWDDASEDGADDSDDESSSDMSNDEFEPKSMKLDSASAKDSILVAKNKNVKGTNKQSPGNKFERGDGILGKQKKQSPLKQDSSFSKQNNQDQSPKTAKMKLQGGVEVEEIRMGNGPVAKPGKHVHLYYVGKLPNNKEFDSVTKGKPFSFRLGKGEVIKGWDVAIQGMKVGGKRKIAVPPQMGYGNKSQGPIPANSTLHFEVELKAVS